MTRRVAMRALAGAMASVLAVVLVACSGDPEEEEVTLPGDSPPPAPTTEAPAPLTPEEEEVLAVFNAFRELEVELYTDPDFEEALERMPEFITGPLLSSLAAGVEILEFRNQVRTGQPTWDPTVLEVSADSATIRDCYDATNWVLIDSDTGEPVPEQETIGSGASDMPAGRHVLHYEAVSDESGNWLFQHGRFERDEQC